MNVPAIVALLQAQQAGETKEAEQAPLAAVIVAIIAAVRAIGGVIVVPAFAIAPVVLAGLSDVCRQRIGFLREFLSLLRYFIGTLFNLLLSHCSCWQRYEDGGGQKPTLY